MVRRVGYPPDQKLEIRYPFIIRIFKISISVSIHIYAHGRTNGLDGLVGRVEFGSFLPTPTQDIVDCFLLFFNKISQFSMVNYYHQKYQDKILFTHNNTKIYVRNPFYLKRKITGFDSKICSGSNITLLIMSIIQLTWTKRSVY